MKKSILFAYNYMMIGGSTTSLLSILNEINYDEYNVDLICLDAKGALYEMIPERVSHTYAALETGDSMQIKKMLNPITDFYAVYSRFMAKILSKKYSYGGVKAQIMNRETARISKRLDKHYDVAIAFIETWATEYVRKYVNADKKYAWFHLDYIGSKFCPYLDRHTYDSFNDIILVSEQCKMNFNKLFPQYKEKTMLIENILTDKYIRTRAKQFDQNDIRHRDDTLQLITTCRIDFAHKGVDRAAKMLAKAIAEAEKGAKKIKWHVFGDGADLPEFRKIVKEYDLTDVIYLYGAEKNPLPWVAAADIFLLPSRYEGKPMAVTEAQMLGVPPFVTNYASASEQIENGVDGIIVDNSDQGLLDGFRRLLQGKIDVQELTRNVRSKNYSNIKELDKIYELIEK